jgi:hypothetical protein
MPCLFVSKTFLFLVSFRYDVVVDFVEYAEQAHYAKQLLVFSDLKHLLCEETCLNNDLNLRHLFLEDLQHTAPVFIVLVESVYNVLERSDETLHERCLLLLRHPRFLGLVLDRGLETPINVLICEDAQVVLAASDLLLNLWVLDHF